MKPVRSGWALGSGLYLLAAILALRGGPAVTVTVERGSPQAVSRFAPGMCLVDHALFYPRTDPAAVKRVIGLCSRSFGFIYQPTLAWGAADPWPDPSQPEPSNWTSLDQHMEFIRATGCTPMLALCEAPWWMKGKLQADGSTRVLAASDEFAPIAYQSRVLDDHMDRWVHLVGRMAGRYMAPPFNLRYFVVWNEFKGYWNPTAKNPHARHWDYDDSPGDPRGPNAKHGYTYMYNRVEREIVRVGAGLGIPAGELKFGGPYNVMESGGSPEVTRRPSAVAGPWGVVDQGDLDAVAYWLRHNAGAQFVAVDGSNRNKWGGKPDPFAACDKFAAINTWLRSQTELPIVWAEWYGGSQTADANYTAAVATYGAMRQILSGASAAFVWGGDGGRDGKWPALWSALSQTGGGEPMPFSGSLEIFRRHFGPGTALYRVTVSDPRRVGALACKAKTLIVNKTAEPVTVLIDASVVRLPPYGIRLCEPPGPTHHEPS